MLSTKKSVLWKGSLATITSILALVIISLPLSSGAQQAPKVPRIGLLHYGHSNPYIDPFREGLREVGYVDGQNIVIEYRYAQGGLDRLPDLAADLVRLKVDLIVTWTGPVTRVTKKATKTIPIVMASASHPVEDGYVDSLARPGGNITGLTSLAHELSGKRLELLKEAIPGISRVAVLTTQEHYHAWPEKMEAAARATGVQLQILKVQATNEIASAFSAITKSGTDALVVIPNPMLNTNRKQIVELAAKSRVPAIYPQRDYLDAGGLMYFGANEDNLARRAALFVHRILKGADPANIPVETPARFDLGINLKTARALGLTLPAEILARANEVIK